MPDSPANARQPLPLLCEEMGTGSEPWGEIRGERPSGEVPVPLSSRALRDILLECLCPACGHHVAVPFYDGGQQPLTTLAWPQGP